MKLFLITLSMLPMIVFAKGYGVVTLVRGKAIQQTASGQKNEVKKGGKIFETDTITTSATSVVRIVMMDTNIIDIYPNSKLLIKEYVYEPKLDKKNVRLEVSAGRIKSTVKQKYDNDRNKYQVKTPVVIAGVRGTIFTAEHESASGLSRIQTLEGNVMVGRIDAGDQVKEFFSVKANQIIQIDRQTEKPQVKDIPKVEVERQKEQDKKDGFARINSEPVDRNAGQNSRQGNLGTEAEKEASQPTSLRDGNEQITSDQHERALENLRERSDRQPASTVTDSIRIIDDTPIKTPGTGSGTTPNGVINY